MKAWTAQRLLIVLVALAGIGVLLYPTAAAWFSDRKHATEVSGYVDSVDQIPDARKQQLLREAREYNHNLPAGPLRDPYALSPSGDQTDVGGGSETYLTTLTQEPGGIMARIRIPSIEVDLPIYHGTDPATLENGVGHLFGSGLPVGGEGNHTVLTAHTGLVNSTLFTDVNQLDEGDLITVEVMDETLYYAVDQILTVLPHETEALRQVPGEDHLSLVTCTPIGVNTHRLLVRAVRVDAPPAEDTARTLGNDTKDPGFPWWALILLAGGVGAVLLTRPRPAQDREDEDDDGDAHDDDGASTAPSGSQDAAPAAEERHEH